MSRRVYTQRIQLKIYFLSLNQFNNIGMYRCDNYWLIGIYLLFTYLLNNILYIDDDGVVKKYYIMYYIEESLWRFLDTHNIVVIFKDLFIKIIEEFYKNYK